MGESRARIGFGQVDLQIEQETGEAFGELDWDLPESSPPNAEAASPNTRQTVRRDDEEMHAVVEEEREKTPPPSSRLSGQHGVPSASGVEATGNRVAMMREAYARGDAEGALAIASAMATMPPPSGGFDHPDAAAEVEIGGEVELDIDIDEEEPVHAKDLTRFVPPATFPRMNAVAVEDAVEGSDGGAALSSLTERQGIPRILVGAHEISKLPIDHRGAFLLGFIDGMQTMEEILDVCAMPQSEALELIRTLVDMEVIEIE
jgi:hypothetical protein